MTRAELRVTWPQALAWRLRRQLLDRRSDDPAADVVRRLGAVLSMDESLARIAVATRRADGDGGALAQAYRDGEVIKGFAFHVAGEGGRHAEMHAGAGDDIAWPHRAHGPAGGQRNQAHEGVLRRRVTGCRLRSAPIEANAHVADIARL